MVKNIQKDNNDDLKKITEIEDQNNALKKIFLKLKSKHQTNSFSEIDQKETSDTSNSEND